MTAIYGLYDPRDPDIIMYVGKGLAGRARRHWMIFLSRDDVVNGLLRRWFEQLKANGLKYSWRFLEENVAEVGWEEREQYWIAYWREKNPGLCNVAKGGNAWSLESCKLGGQVAQKLYPNLASETMKRTLKLYPDLAAANGRRWGGIAFKRLWKEDPERLLRAASKGGHLSTGKGALLQWAKEYPEKKKAASLKGGQNGGHAGGSRTQELYGCFLTMKDRLKGTHQRWHVARGMVSSSCIWCQQNSEINSTMPAEIEVVKAVA